MDLKSTKNDQQIEEKINELVREYGGDPEEFDCELVKQMVKTSLRFIKDNHNTAQLKLVNRALKELRYAYRIFNKHPGEKRLSIFGSSRTPEDHQDYITARNFSAEMAKKNWMCITGAADGIMKAGHEGSSAEASFGLSIRLASFETSSNELIEGDPKNISFKYFFTRKLMFMSHSEAIAVLPGGVGTMDELFEILTLLQMGKSQIIPVVLLEGEGGVYWKYWLTYVKKNLLANGWISEEDLNFFHIAKDVKDGVEHVNRFYSRYHSSRFVGKQFVIRMHSPLTEDQVSLLNEKYQILLQEGKFVQGKALKGEEDALELPRISFHFKRRHYGTLRALIDQINAF